MPSPRFPKGVPGGRGGHRTLNATAYSHLVAGLLERAMTRPEVQEHAGLGEALTIRLIRALRTRGLAINGAAYNHVLHVESWKKDKRGYPTLAAFRLGPGPDAPQPKKPRAQVVRDYMQRKKRKTGATT